jgi:hypothetical protein
MTEEQFEKIKTYLNEEIEASRNNKHYITRLDFRDKFGLEDDFYDSLVEFVNEDGGFAVKKHFAKLHNYDIEFFKP